MVLRIEFYCLKKEWKKFLTADEFRACLEAELQWRQEEIAFFGNILNNFEKEDEKRKYRKSMVLILYSHMEGFIKISLQSYVQYINSLHIPRKNFVSELKASGMHKEFLAYENLDRKCAFFKRELPDDSNLHRFYRRVDFIEQFTEFDEAILNIDDTTVDTESNIWYVVLQKNLYKLGLPVDMFEKHQKDIDGLVNRRNAIAHGNSRSGVEAQELDKWEKAVYDVSSEMMRLLYDYVNHQKYLLAR